MNIRIGYLYRDVGNFKSYGCIVVENPGQLPAPIVEKELRRVLLDAMYFVASSVSLPDLRFTPLISHLDHDWHELEEVVDSTQPQSDPQGRNAREIVNAFQAASRKTRAHCLPTHEFGLLSPPRASALKPSRTSSPKQ
jgi:hypothetical protein